jgi:HlyD family secretion protein
MRRAPWPTVSDRPCPADGRRRVFRLLALAAFAALAPGCGAEPKIDFTRVSDPPVIRVIEPPVRNIVRVVGQPSFINSYERTSIYPKLTAYIEKWIVDIGDKVKKGDVLATLFVPELVEDYGTKTATVELDKQRVDLARKMVDVAEADVKSARARLDEAKAILAKFKAEVDRWDTEVKRLKKETERGVVDPQILLESTNQWKSSVAEWDSAKATVAKAEAELLSSEAELAAAKVDVAVADADLSVAESEAKRLEAWVGYLKLPAPYDGVIVARNANTGDFVLPMTGDPTAMARAPHLAPGGGAAPIYVVDRTDIVRIFVDIPEQDADYVHRGTKATVLVEAYSDDPLTGTVTRTSWALNVKSRTLRAEIDLPNPGGQLRPGMYAYADVTIDRPGIRALPHAALSYKGDQAFCWRFEDGKAVRTEIRTGIEDGDWIEVSKQRSASHRGGKPVKKDWMPISGSEQVILGDLSLLTNGESVRVAPATSESRRR